MNTEHNNDDLYSEKRKNIFVKINKRQLRNKVIIFLICLLISFSLWYLVGYSQKETEDLIFPVYINGLPNGYVLAGQSDKEISVQVQTSLYNIDKLKKKGKIIINLSNVTPHKVRQRYLYEFAIEPELQHFFKQLDYRDRFSLVTPDTIVFFMEKSIKKEVPIISDIQYSIADHYRQFSSMLIIPENIVIEGKPEQLDTIHEIKTHIIDLGIIKDSVNKMIALEKPSSLRLSQDSVRVIIPIMEYTEKTIEVTIKIDSLHDGGIIKLFPDHATIFCLVPVAQYNDISSSMFTVEAYYNAENATTATQLPVKVITTPENVFITRMIPDYVDYIILAPK